MMEGKSAGFGLYPDSQIFYAYRPYFASGFPTVSLGVAERMLEVFREKPKTAYVPTPRCRRRSDPGADAPGRVHHQVAAARAFWRRPGKTTPNTAPPTATQREKPWRSGAPTRPTPPRCASKR